ncbi:MAG: PQQ-binding-like beta-propeller repeat protein, partial [Caulobacteraceae bacterium]
KDLGVSSWPGDAWKHGGATVWGYLSYDPVAKLIYYGTANPSPRVPAQRPGDNLWGAAMFARDPATGMAKWAFQFTPHDQWDYDGVNEDILIDATLAGRPRKLLVHLDRNGFGYTLDRLTGKIVLVKPFADINWAKGIDLATGRPIVDPEKAAQVERKVMNICPTHIGAKDWEPSAFSPRTGLIYADIFNICMDLTDHKVAYIPGTPYDGMDLQTHSNGNTKKWGEFIAWNPLTGQKAWSIPEDFMTMSGVLATGGDVVFYGTTDGWFRGVDARSGKVLWSQKLSSGITSQPIAYLGPDGREYIAVIAGVGGVASQVMGRKNGFPPRGGTLYVFSVDGASPMSGAGMISTVGSGAPAAHYDTGD